MLTWAGGGNHNYQKKNRHFFGSLSALYCWSANIMFSKHELERCHPVWCVSNVIPWIMPFLTEGNNKCQQLPSPVWPPNQFSVFEYQQEILNWAYGLIFFMALTSIHCRLITSFVPDTSKGPCPGYDAFIPSSIPLQRALALTEQSVTAMFIVHALNRRHMVWATVSGAKFVPLCSFRGYLWLAPCWLVALLADNESLCVTVC